MSTTTGIISTTFTLRPKVSRDTKEDGKRVHKVSLVNSSNVTNSSDSYRIKDESNLKDKTEVYEGRLEPVDAWQTPHENYLSLAEKSGSSVLDRSESGSTYLSSSFSSSYYEPTYTSYSSSLERERETPPSTVDMDTTSSLSNSSWWNVRSEVRDNTETEAGRRSWAELAKAFTEREVEGNADTANLNLHSSTDETDSFFGVFKATRVELEPSSTGADPEPLVATSPHEMDTLLDRLKNMAPPIRQRHQHRSTQPFSSLPPIVEDAPNPVAVPISIASSAAPSISLPPDLGLNWTAARDMRSPLAMMKEQQDSETSSRNFILPSRASAISSIVMRKSSLPNLTLDEGSQVNGLLLSSRLDNSLIFSSYRSSHLEENGNTTGHRPLYRAASLPEVNSTSDYMSTSSKNLDLASSTYELSYFPSSTNSLSSLLEAPRISRSPLIIHSPQPESPTSNNAPSLNLDLHSLSPESPVKPPSLQRRLSNGAASSGSPVYNGGSFGFIQESGPDRNLLAKYRAFPDAYRTKEKEHGKLNPRPGKLIIYSRPGRQGHRTEVGGDVVDATQWEFPDASISIRVVRGGWVLYEKPDFKGEKIPLDEGDIELTCPFRPTQDEHTHLHNGELKENGQEPEHSPKRFVIGSLRRAVRDYSVPEICLFPEENAEGKKVVFRDTSEDSRIYGFPIKANSIIINAGLWLVFAEPFFQGVPRVLEVGGFPNPAAWGVQHPYVGSLHPLKIGEPTVEMQNEPKLVIYDKPYFTGKSREIYTTMRDFMTKTDQKQTAFMYSAGSIKVLGGIWVGYEKEGFRGHQYLLEEGDYQDWRTWGGCDSELRSLRVIRTDLSQPMLLMFEKINENDHMDEERTLEVMEAIPDVELVDFSPSVHSIHVLSGAWVAYSHVDYSGNQYILEKGFYRNCADWGATDNQICSIQPICSALTDRAGFHSELLLYSEPNFQGTCQVHCEGEELLPQRHKVQSCRVVGGSWVLYDDANFNGNQYVISEGDYANLPSMGCPEHCTLQSIKPVPITMTVPSISLYGLELFEGREITLDVDVSNMMMEGINPHFLSVKVNHGCWVVCEHSNYRGRQFLLEPMEIMNWYKFSNLTSIGSLYPIREKRRLFRIRYKETGLCMSVQGGIDTMKTGRIVVSEQVDGTSDVWFFHDGLIKNKMVQTMSLQVVGNVESGAKVVLWSETRLPIQTWNFKLNGPISSLTYPGMVLDVKGGKTYDREHVIIRGESEEDSIPLWEIELL